MRGATLKAVQELHGLLDLPVPAAAEQHMMS
jgi:hypothetical protein